jgi:hypothetical protein
MIATGPFIGIGSRLSGASRVRVLTSRILAT